MMGTVKSYGAEKRRETGTREPRDARGVMGETGPRVSGSTPTVSPPGQRPCCVPAS